MASAILLNLNAQAVQSMDRRVLGFDGLRISRRPDGGVELIPSYRKNSTEDNIVSVHRKGKPYTATRGQKSIELQSNASCVISGSTADEFDINFGQRYFLKRLAGGHFVVDGSEAVITGERKRLDAAAFTATRRMTPAEREARQSGRPFIPGQAGRKPDSYWLELAAHGDSEALSKIRSVPRLADKFSDFEAHVTEREQNEESVETVTLDIASVGKAVANLTQDVRRLNDQVAILIGGRENLATAMVTVQQQMNSINDQMGSLMKDDINDNLSEDRHELKRAAG